MLNRVVRRPTGFPLPLDAPVRDCVFGAAIEIIPSGSRRFVLVVVVAKTATVMSGGASRGVTVVWRKLRIGETHSLDLMLLFFRLVLVGLGRLSTRISLVEEVSSETVMTLLPRISPVWDDPLKSAVNQIRLEVELSIQIAV